MENKNKEIIILLIIVSFISFLSFFLRYVSCLGLIPWKIGYNDIWVFRWFASHPSFPYQEKTIEYPVIIGIFIHTMGFLGKTSLGYFILSSIFLSIFALMTSFFLYKISIEEKIKKMNLYYFWVFAPSFFLFLIFNWDIITIFFCVMTLYFFKKNMNKSAAFALSMGFATKIYPILFLFPMILKRNFKYQIEMLIVFFVSFLAINSYFILKNFDGWINIYTFQSDRSPNPDSIWGIIYNIFPKMNVEFINSLTLIAFVGFYILIIWKMRKRSILDLCFSSLLLFLLINKVFSPQYIIWLLMFFVLSDRMSKFIFYSLEMSNIIVLFSILSWIFVVPKEIIFISINNISVLIRHIILTYLLFLVYSKKIVFKGI